MQKHTPETNKLGDFDMMFSVTGTFRSEFDDTLQFSKSCWWLVEKKALGMKLLGHKHEKLKHVL